MTKWCQTKGKVIGSLGNLSRVPCGDLRPMSVDASPKENPLVLSDVPLLLVGIFLVKTVNCAFSLGDDLLTFRFGCSVTRLDGLLLLFAPFPGKVHERTVPSRGR